MTQQPSIKETRKQQQQRNYQKRRKAKGLKSRAEFWIEKRFKLIFGDKKDG